jgi:hypothetical protein
MFGVKRSAALAAIFVLATSYAASAHAIEIAGGRHADVASAGPKLVGAARDAYASDPTGEAFEATQDVAKDVVKPTFWAMLIVGFAHLGVSLRCRAAVLRLQPMLARRGRRPPSRTRGR